MITDVYTNTHRSILAFLNQFLSRNGITGFEVFDFDEHVTESNWPNSDLIGIQEYIVENDRETYFSSVMFIVCTKSDDANLKRLRPVVNTLLNELETGRSNSNLKLLDSNGTEIGKLVVSNDITVAAVGKTETRPVIPLFVRFGVSRN